MDEGVATNAIVKTMKTSNEKAPDEPLSLRAYTAVPGSGIST